MESQPPASRAVAKHTLLTWDQELLDNFVFEYDPDSGTRAVKATCKFCQKYYPKISSQYRGKLVKDVETYGKTGTTYLLKPNLKM